MPPSGTSAISILEGGAQGAASTGKRFAPLYGAVDATILSLGEAAERTVCVREYRTRSRNAADDPSWTGSYTP
jgi:hypothetical protein